MNHQVRTTLRAEPIRRRILFIFLLSVLMCLVGLSLRTKTSSAHEESAQQPKSPKRRDSRKTPKQPFEQTYKEVVADRAELKQKELAGELKRLQSISEKYEPAILDAQKKLGFDHQAFLARAREIAAQQDYAGRQKLWADFYSKYSPQMKNVAETAGIEAATIRQQIISELNLSATRTGNDAPQEEQWGVSVEDEPRQSSPPASTTGGTAATQFYRAPFSGAGTQGSPPDATARADDGSLFVENSILFAGSNQKLAFVPQALEVRSGVNWIKAFATFDRVRYELRNFVIASYASSEAIVNLRVMEGSREMCSERLSLGRVINAVFGEGRINGERPVQLHCEFNRVHPEDETVYNVVAELEGWAGGGGPVADAWVRMSAVVQELRISQR